MPALSSLSVIPVIDVSHGRVVRARRGDRAAYRPIATPLVAGSDPCDVARALLARVGAATPTLYVADLDALQGGAPQAATLARLVGALPGVTLWIDAGFDGVAAAQALRGVLAAGRWRAVYGSESLADAKALEALAREPGAILSLDCRHARPLDPAGCWTRPHAWPGTLIVMTLDRVGAGEGPDLATFARLRAAAPDRQWIGAGGVRDAGDLAAAAAAGADGWLVASALHDGRLPAAG
ncbi:MAG TPA: HisA/HisF-related TIM barrel protein [Albitalea sp.]